MIFVFLLVFAIYVRSVPPKAPRAEPMATTTAYQGEIPEYFNVDTIPLVKEAMDEADQVMKHLPKDGETVGNVNSESFPPNAEL